MSDVEHKDDAASVVQTMSATSRPALIVGLTVTMIMGSVIDYLMTKTMGRGYGIGLFGAIYYSTAIWLAALLVRRRGPIAVTIAVLVAALLQTPMPMSPFHSTLLSLYLNWSMLTQFAEHVPVIPMSRYALMALTDVSQIFIVTIGAYLIARNHRWLVTTSVEPDRKTRRALLLGAIVMFLLPMLGVGAGALGVAFIAVFTLPFAIPVLIAFAAAAVASLVPPARNR